MSATIAIDPKKYARLLSKALPAVIGDEAEYNRLLTQTRDLMERDEESLSAEEAKLLDLLIHLIDQYEDKNYPIDPVHPHAMLQHLMEARSLTHKDVWPLFGSKGVASEVLNGKRSVSKAQAKKLAAFFHVSADLFI